MVLTKDGSAARLVAKYRPPCPVVVVSPNARALRSLAISFGLFPCKVRPRALLAVTALSICRLTRHSFARGQPLPLPKFSERQISHLQVDSFDKGPAVAVRAGIEAAMAGGLAVDGIKAIVVTGGSGASADASPVLTGENLGARGRAGCVACATC